MKNTQKNNVLFNRHLQYFRVAIQGPEWEGFYLPFHFEIFLLCFNISLKKTYFFIFSLGDYLEKVTFGDPFSKTDGNKTEGNRKTSRTHRTRKGSPFAFVNSIKLGKQASKI